MRGQRGSLLTQNMEKSREKLVTVWILIEICNLLQHFQGGHWSIPKPAERYESPQHVLGLPRGMPETPHLGGAQKSSTLSPLLMIQLLIPLSTGEPSTLQRKLISAAGILDLILSVTNHSSCGEELRKHGLRLGGADSPSRCFTLSYQVIQC